MTLFQRKLEVLEYEDADKLNANELDGEHIKKFVCWLEEQKIRQYKIEERKKMLNFDSDQWQATFEKYIGNLGGPTHKTRLQQIEWIINLAIKLDYTDSKEIYKPVKSDQSKNNSNGVANVKSTNPLDNLDFQSSEFKDGVNKLAKLLSIPLHPNHLVTLEACSKFICKRLNSDAVQKPNSVIVRGTPFPMTDIDVGYNMGDPVLNNAVKVLNLLYIHDLRNLQTKINEAIVSVQKITANPKTDTKLGKVGR